MNENLILVYYIGVGQLNENDVERYINAVVDKIKSNNPFVTEMIVIPTQEENTRIECINPKYITEPELIREHRLKMDVLHEHLTYQIKTLKKDEENGR